MHSVHYYTSIKENIFPKIGSFFSYFKKSSRIFIKLSGMKAAGLQCCHNEKRKVHTEVLWSRGDKCWANSPWRHLPTWQHPSPSLIALVQAQICLINSQMIVLAAAGESSQDALIQSKVQGSLKEPFISSWCSADSEICMRKLGWKQFSISLLSERGLVRVVCVRNFCSLI